MKSRRLKQCVGRQGAEGAKDDDWLCVDCYDTVAHFMMPSKSNGLIDYYLSLLVSLIKMYRNTDRQTDREIGTDRQIE